MNNKWELRQKHIDNLACLIKFGDLKDYQRVSKEVELWDELRALGKIYANKRRLRIKDGCENDWTTILDDSMLRALNAYGKLDETTGERIPFMKLFWSIFSNVISWEYAKDIDGNLVSKKGNSEFEARSNQAKAILKTYAINQGIDYKLPKNISSRSSFINELTFLGMAIVDAENVAEYVFTGIKVVSISLEDDEIDKPIDIVDSSFVEDNGVNNALGEVLAMCHRLLASKTIKNRIKDFVRYYMTIVVYETNLYMDDLYAPYINHKYMEALVNKSACVTNYEVLAEILDLKPDTVRKSIVYARKCLLNVKI